MSSKVNIITNQDFFDGRSHAHRFAVPIRRNCPTINTPFVFEGGQYNCNRCESESAFCMPWEPGDVFPFAFSFPDEYNADPMNPTAGWIDAGGTGYMEITVLDCECNEIISGAHNVATDYYVTWCEETQNVQQVLFFDTRILPLDLDCFTIQIRVLDFDNNEIYRILSNEFCKNGCNADGTVSQSNVPTVRIESTNLKSDCVRRCYGSPDANNTFGAGDFPAFYNAIRVTAVFDFIGAGAPQTQTTDSGYVLSTTTSRIYRLITLPIPPYMVEWLSAILESDGTITINGLTFEAGNVSITSTPVEGTKRLCVTADLFISCTVDNRTC